MKIPFGYLYKRSGKRYFPATSRRAGTFYFSNPDPSGKDHPVSLRTEDKETAELRAVELCGRVSLTNDQEWLQSLADLGRWAGDRLTDDLKQSVDFSNVWNVYEASRRRPASGPATLKHYGVIWKAFSDWRVAGGDCRMKTLDGLAAATCEQYVAQLEERLKQSSVIKHLAVLKLIFRIVCPDAVNPWDGLQVMKESVSTRKRALEPDEVRRLVQSSLAFAVKDERYRPPKVISSPRLGKELSGLHLVGYWTGLRLGDAVHLAGEAIDRKARVIRIVPAKTGRRKPTALEIPVSAELMDFFDEAAPLRGPVFPELITLYGKNGAKLCELLGKVWKEAEVLDDERGTASFHSLRVTFQSLMDAAGTSRVFTRSVTGHSSAKMSDTYSRSDVERVRAAVGKALPPVMG